MTGEHPLYTPVQMAELRELLAMPVGDPGPSAEDVLAVLDAQQIVNAESCRWHGLE